MTGIFGIYVSEDERIQDYDKLKSACGLEEISDVGTLITMVGLFNLQHRGQLSAKIIDNHGKVIEGKGLIVDIIKNGSTIFESPDLCFGTVNNYFNGAGGGTSKNHEATRDKKKIRFVNDGHPVFQNILNNLEDKNLNEEIIRILQTSKENDIISIIKEVLSKVNGSYSWIFSYDEKIIAVRQGATPLHMAKSKNKSYLFASEPCAFADFDLQDTSPLKPGEIVCIHKDSSGELEIERSKLDKSTPGCAFELVYRARPDSNIFGENVAQFRIDLGRELAKEDKVSADLVIPVPEAGIFAATGYAQESGIPLVQALIRDYTMGRYFFEADQIKRNALIKRKLKVVKELVRNKRVVVVDEAIITGSTLTIVTELLRSAGAKEIHLRIPSPIHKSSCDKGFLSPKKDLLFNKLIKNPSNTSNEQAEKAFKEYFKSDSISFLEKERFMTKKLEGFLCCKCLCEQS